MKFNLWHNYYTIIIFTMKARLVVEKVLVPLKGRIVIEFAIRKYKYKNNLNVYIEIQEAGVWRTKYNN